jgi:general secretion pathway protein D
MKIKQLGIITVLLFCLPVYFTYSQSIAEKKASLKTSNSDLDQDTEQFLTKINLETREIQGELQYLYSEALRLYQENATSFEYKELLEQINYKRHYLQQLEESWREMVVRNNRSEGYGLWHAPETNLEQLIIDYGSQDYVYLIPPDVGSIKLSIDSNLPIPRSAWSEMLELILKENGVGIRPLNPYLRQLYLVKNNNSNLHLITNKPKDLEVLKPEARVSFVLSPEPADVRRTYSFLERFINPQTTTLQNLGRDILLIGPAGELQDLLRLYGFIASNRGEKDYRLLPLSKIRADEMARMLSAIFDQVEASSGRSVVELEPTKGGGRVENLPDSNGLRIITLQNQALFLVGTKEEIRKAEQIVQNVENQIGGVRDKIVFWYTVKHSDPEELADVLYRVYGLMMATGSGSEPPPGSFGPGGPLPSFGGPGPFPPNGEGPGGAGGSVQNRVVVVDNNRSGPSFPPPIPPQKEPPLLLYGQEGYYQEGGYVVNPAPAQPRIFTSDNPNSNRDNFIVDPKTGAIVMVVEADLLPKIKDLVRKLDIKKKMVQIETLLFEKILNRENSFGLNLLKIGDAATQKHATGAVFNNLFPGGPGAIPILANAGVFEFFISRKKTDSGIPAFDLVYRFLLSQDDVQINTSPSLLTVNQTPATISINEDLSINTGIFEVETAKGVTLKDAFTRAQYGITISIKPTIHLTQHDEEEEDAYDYVTLDTDITFDTIQGGDPSRPNVTRRHITNQVQVPDGDTVVLGGLRRKVSNDSRESIPFIGELPGLGKLFSINTLRDSSTEMFIFITPHIVKDPKEQLSCLRQELLCLRPGDIPYFLECVEEAHQYEKTRLMEGSMTMLFGRPRDHYYISDCCDTEGMPREYDGR